ncbi:MAG TPA: FAD-dependent monooxygenase [Gemmatimonadetes bacterium]|nr:FAD-dependent monooxygenase [Gemmatimonadota bacterium]
MKEVLIVGAGPTGLTAGIELARQGIIPQVIDKKEKPSSLSRAVGILPHSMRLLEPSGAAEEISKEGFSVSKVRFYRNDTLFTSVDFEKYLDESDLKIVALPQDKTEAVLSSVFSGFGGEVQYNTELSDLSQENGKVRVVVNGFEKSFDYVIGADGTRSKVRDICDIEFAGYDLDEDWSICDLYLKESQSIMDFHLFIKKGKTGVAMIPLEPRRIRLISNTPDALQEIPIDLEVDHVRRSGAFTIPIRQAVEYKKGNVLLAGDAAHSQSPVGGRGMNLGIADAVELARRLVDNDLDDYHRVRYKVGKDVIRLTERARKVVFHGNSFEKTLLLLMFYLVSRVGFLRRLFTHEFLNPKL